MLQNLYIKNYVIIKELNIDFNTGFTAITGETGAGKSILLGALSLIMGKRADTSVLRSNDEKCIIEANFDIKEYNLQNFFEQNELDYDENTIIRREINPKGKSRAFINDSPVSLAILQELSDKLLDVHTQNSQHLLKSKSFYFLLLDNIAKINKQVADYQAKYKQLKNLEKEAEKLKSEIDKQKQDADYLQFRFNQIAEANLQSDEQEELEKEQKTLSNAEEIKQELSKAYYLLYEDDENIIAKLKQVHRIFENLQRFDIEQSYAERINSAIIELNDIASDAEILNNSIELDQTRLFEVEERLNLIYDLQQKFSVSSIKDLLKIKDDLEAKLLNINTGNEKLKELQKQIDTINKDLWNLAKEISLKRKNTAKQVQKKIENILKQLGIKNANFEIRIEQNNELNNYGIDVVKFLFSANKTSDLQEINKSASGGELSRIMLAIKSIITKTVNLPTIIFDEIDTGVSGEIASKMAEIMLELSKTTQVLSITHLPQIAAVANYHFVVYKTDSKNETITNIKQLTENERINEIAKMLSGKNITQSAINNAKDLLKIK